jgi:hypothetical protein
LAAMMISIGGSIPAWAADVGGAGIGGDWLST